MADNARAFARTPARYFPYVEARPGEGRGLLEALAANAAAVVTDDAPVFFLPRMIAAAAGRLDVRVEAVDGNGLHPLRAVDRVFPTAFSYRAHLQKTLRRHLDDVPRTNPLAGVRLPPAPALDAVLARWPEASPALLTGAAGALASLPIDHDVAPVPVAGRGRGGAGPAEGVRRARPRHLRRRSPRSGRSADQRPVAVPALRPRIGARGVRRGDDARGLDAPEAGRERRRQARGLVGRQSRRGGVPGPARHVARARVQRRRAPRRPRPLRHAAGVGAGDAGRARPRSAAAPLRPRRVRAGGDARSAVERGADGAGARRPHPHLPAHAVGQEDPRMVAHAAGRARHDDPLERQVRAGRPRSQLLQRHLLVPGPLRSAVGAGARDLRDGALHEQREHRAQAAGQGLPGPLRSVARS